MLTDVGPVDLQVPRDRTGSFGPQIVPKHTRRAEGFDEAIVSLYAKGLTTGEIQARLAETYDMEVSRATDKVAAELGAWPQRPLDRVYAVVMIDADAAEARFSEFEAEWGDRYPASIATWRRNWDHFVVFLRFPPEIRKIVYTTNTIESLNSRFRQATRRRGRFPTQEAAPKVLCLVIRDRRRPNQPNVTGQTRDWKTAINTLTGFYGDRVTDNQ